MGDDPEGAEGGEKAEVPKTHKTRVMCKAEKSLVRARITAKMVFTKKVNLFKDRLSSGDQVDVLRGHISSLT